MKKNARSNDYHIESLDQGGITMKWPHSPVHWSFEPGIYMVTAGTHHKLRLLNTRNKLNFFQEQLFMITAEYGWQLQAWAVLPAQCQLHFPIDDN